MFVLNTCPENINIYKVENFEKTYRREEIFHWCRNQFLDVKKQTRRKIVKYSIFRKKMHIKPAGMKNFSKYRISVGQW